MTNQFLRSNDIESLFCWRLIANTYSDYTRNLWVTTFDCKWIGQVDLWEATCIQKVTVRQIGDGLQIIAISQSESLLHNELFAIGHSNELVIFLNNTASVFAIFQKRPWVAFSVSLLNLRGSVWILIGLTLPLSKAEHSGHKVPKQVKSCTLLGNRF